MSKPTLKEAKKILRSSTTELVTDDSATRGVYRWRDNPEWVYKYENYVEGYDDEQQNDVEWEAYLELKDTMSDGIRIPEMHYLGIMESGGEEFSVLAARFIEGTEPPMCLEWDRDTLRHRPKCKCEREMCWREEIGASDVEYAACDYVDDMHAGNVIIDNEGIIWLIDLGGGTTK